MKGIYLFANRARHQEHEIIYNDSEDKYNCDITGNALDVQLDEYDFIIATPPCNWWSRANYRRNTSPYALATKELLPKTIEKLANQNKPFIIENVKNKTRMEEEGIFTLIKKHKLYCQHVGRHIYISNIWCELDCPQIQDFKEHGILINGDKYRQGGTNVHRVIEKWLAYIKEYSLQI